MHSLDLCNHDVLDKVFKQVESSIYNTALQCHTNNQVNLAPANALNISSNVYDIEHRIKNKEIQKWEKILSSNDSKQLWKEIEWKEKSGFEEMRYPTAEQLGNHFKEKSIIVENEYFNPVINRRFVPSLDMPITIDEISKASKRLKEKSSSDGWIPRMITSIRDTLYTILLVLFNIILQCASYPSTWRTSVVAAIFKNKGSSWIPKFYRPISLVVLLSKLFDFILLERFKNWFVPNNCQSAYQTGRNCAEHVFLIRAMISHCLEKKSKLFVICVDFEGAFDKVSRHKLFRKMQLFGVGTTFLFCIIAIYSYTDCIIYQKETYYAYHLLAGIKQGLPLSPWLFLFYINDIFDLFEGIYGISNSLNALHLLIHADDTTIIATSRTLAENKIRTLISYCKQNSINLEISKCEFIVVNGDAVDQSDFILPNGKIKYVEYFTLLGSQISGSGKLKSDLNLHMQKRLHAVSKFYNFLRTNKLAPLSVKLKVLEACVCSTLLHNCETFSNKLPDDLETTYFSLLKSCLGVRMNTPNLLVLLESSMQSLQSMIFSRQLQFYQGFQNNLQIGSARFIVFHELLMNNSPYLQHYVSLNEKYSTRKEIVDYYRADIMNKIRHLAISPSNYKYHLYAKFNPALVPLDIKNTKIFTQKFLRLRLSSHSFPIETGRWSRTKREDRLCTRCNVLGDESHYIYDCLDICRDDLNDIPDFCNLASYDKLHSLLQKLKDYL